MSVKLITNAVNDISVTPVTRALKRLEPDEFVGLGRVKQKNLSMLHKIIIPIDRKIFKDIEGLTRPQKAQYFFDYITKKMGIPDELKPQIIINEYNREGGHNRSFAYFTWSENELAYNVEPNKKLGDWWHFGLIRHELEHFRQTIDIFRSDKLFGELCSGFGYDPRYYEEFRSSVLKHYPKIKDNSKEYKIANKYLNNQFNYIRTNRTGFSRFLDPKSYKYFFQIIEWNACKAQGLNWINFIFNKLINCLLPRSVT